MRHIKIKVFTWLLGILALSACTGSTEEVPPESGLIDDTRERGSSVQDVSGTDGNPVSDSGKEGDPDPAAEGDKARLTDMDVHPLYVDFLQGKISATHSYFYEGEKREVECNFHLQGEYDDEGWLEEARKSFALVDVNGDGEPELIFRIQSAPDELMYVLGVNSEQELLCYDVFETHTSRMGFGVQKNGIVYWDQYHTGAEVKLYTYGLEGEPREVLHLVKEPDSGTDLPYDHYYLNGNEEIRYDVQREEDYEEIRAAFYDEEEPVWYECEAFTEIPD